MGHRPTRAVVGFGIGLRRAHCDAVFDHHPGVDFVELLTENFLGVGGRAQAIARRAAATWPVVLHGTALSIGGPDPLSAAYLDALAGLIDTVRPAWFSDHLCSSSAFGVEYHDLMPVPRTEAALDHVSRRIEEVQRRLPHLPFALENPSHYIEYGANRIGEATFLRRLCERTGLKLLLDLNNIYVNAQNHRRFDPAEYLEEIPADAVVQFHLAGHEDLGHVIIDTHGAPIIEPVFDLYRRALRRFGPVPTLLEWDNNLPSLEGLLAENDRVRAVAARLLAEDQPAPGTHPGAAL